MTSNQENSELQSEAADARGKLLIGQRVTVSGKPVIIPDAFVPPEFARDGFAANINFGIRASQWTPNSLVENEVQAISKEMCEGGGLRDFRIVQLPKRRNSTTWVAAIEGTYSYGAWTLAFLEVLILISETPLEADSNGEFLVHVTGTHILSDGMARSAIRSAMSSICIDGAPMLSSLQS